MHVAAGRAHSCAVYRSGRVACWGGAEHGDLGNRERVSAPEPREVEGIDDALDVAIAQRTCVLRRSGRVRCWGDDVYLRADDREPADVPGLDDAVAITAARGMVCALRRSGIVVCFGPRGSDTRMRPTPVTGLGPVSTLRASCARSASGQWWCFESLRAVAVAGLPPGTQDVARLVEQDVWEDGDDRGTTYRAVLGDLVTTCAAVASGPPLCWGDAQHGLLGRQGPPSELARPAAVPGVPEAARVWIGSRHACALATSGAVWCWGESAHGQAGPPSRSPWLPIAPVRIAALDDAVELALGEQHTCAVRRSGRIACWGDGERGQTGDGQTIERLGF